MPNQEAKGHNLEMFFFLIFYKNNGILSVLIWYTECTHKHHHVEAILMSIHNIIFVIK